MLEQNPWVHPETGSRARKVGEERSTGHGPSPHSEDSREGLLPVVTH